MQKKRTHLELIQELFSYLEQNNNLAQKEQIKRDLRINSTTLNNLLKEAEFWYSQPKLIFFKKEKILVLTKENIDLNPNKKKRKK